MIQGFILWGVIQFWTNDPQAAALLAALAAFASIGGLFLQFASVEAPTSRSAVLSALLAGLFAGVAFWAWFQIPAEEATYAGDKFRAFTLIPAFLIALYALLPFVQIFNESGQVQFPYPQLFRHSWNNLFIALLGALFAGVFWILIGLWVVLFKLLGVSFFGDIFLSRGFISVATATMFGLGIALGKEGEAVIATLRRVTLNVFQFLMPLLAFIALLFLAALPFTGLQALWDTKQASPILLSVLGLTVLFLNAVAQDLTAPCPYSRWMKYAVDALLLAAPIFSFLSVYAIGLRIHQYGLTPERFYVALFALIAGVYAVSYAVAVLKREDVWMTSIRPVNVAMSIVVAALALLVHTPVLDPLGWSARSQYQRLVSGKIDAVAFDFAALRFHFGRAGYARLLALEKLEDHPQREIVRDAVAKVRRASSYNEAKGFVPTVTPAQYLKILSGGEPPAGLTEMMFRNGLEYLKTFCVRSRECVLFSLNVDSDPEAEYFLITPGPGYRVLAYDHSADGSWRYIGDYVSRNRVEREALIEQIKRSRTATLRPPFEDVKIGENVFELHLSFPQ